MKSEHTANHGDLVIGLTTSWNGNEVFGGTHRVDKTYKNGNVVLMGMKGQFYHTTTDDGYKLNKCSGTMQFVKLTDDVKLRIEKSKSVYELLTAINDLDTAIRRNRRHVGRMSIEDIKRAQKNLIEIIKLIEGEDDEK